MKTSVLIQVPYELEKNYISLEEQKEIDYAVMPVENFNMGDFLISLYITIVADPVASGILSGMVWDIIKKIGYDVLEKLMQDKDDKKKKDIIQQKGEAKDTQETCIKMSLCIQKSQKSEYRVDAEYTVNKEIDSKEVDKISEKMANQLVEVVRAEYEKCE